VRCRIGTGVTSVAILCTMAACQAPDDTRPTSGSTQVVRTSSDAVPPMPSLAATEIPTAAPFTPAASTPTPSAALSISARAVPLRGEAPLTVDFYGEGLGGAEDLRYRWEFGDGSAAVYHRSARHTYVYAGKYAATLSVSGDGASQSTSLPISVSVRDFACEIEADPDIGLPPLRVKFRVVVADDLPGPHSVHWDFGDSAVATGNPTSHTYLGPGTFTATVTVTDGHGRTVQRDVPIQVDAPDEAD